MLDIITRVQIDNEPQAIACKPGQVESQVHGPDIHRDKCDAFDHDEDVRGEVGPGADARVGQGDALRGQGIALDGQGPDRWTWGSRH